MTLKYIISSNQVEKAKQDDALSDLSNLLGELKDMAVDMGTEIERSVLSSYCPQRRFSQNTLSTFFFDHSSLLMAKPV